MATTSTNIKVKRGDFKAIKINIPIVDEFGDTIDWTDATFLSQIRKSKALASPVLAQFAIDHSHKTDPTPYVVLSLESVTVGQVVGTSDLIAPSDAFWDVQETRDGKPRTFVEGKVKITEDVSR